MRMNPFAAFRNWHASRIIARDLYITLQRIRGPGKGINIPVNNRSKSETARAVDLVLQGHPETSVQVWGDGSLFLCFRDDVALLEKQGQQDVAVGAALQGMGHVTLSQDLVVRTETMREQEPQVLVKHEPRWPGALEDRDPRDVKGPEWREFEVDRAEKVLAKAKEDVARAADGEAAAVQSQVNLTVVATDAGFRVETPPDLGALVGPDGLPSKGAA